MATATQERHVVPRSSTTAKRDSITVDESQEFVDRTLTRRISGGISRRVAYWTLRLHGRPRYDHAERALYWVLANGERILDEQPTSSNASTSLSLIQQAVRVFDRFGQPKAARSWSSRLEGMIHRNNAFTSCETATPPRAPTPKSIWGWTSSFQLAQDAVELYQRNERGAADAVMQRLRWRQREEGSFDVAHPGDGPSENSTRMRTVLYFLEAAQLQVAATFASGADPGYSRIDPSDSRAKAVCDWFAALGAQRNVADLGCGCGRYLRLLANLGGPHKLTGIDPSNESLAYLPQNVHARRGDLLHIPAADGEFDGAFAIESLEHALLPRAAIDELCRVVRPGGQILVIDKHAVGQPLSEYAPWERWFHADELCRWLAPHCDEISVSPLLRGRNRAGQATFLAWYGRRALPLPPDNPTTA